MRKRSSQYITWGTISPGDYSERQALSTSLGEQYPLEIIEKEKLSVHHMGLSIKLKLFENFLNNKNSQKTASDNEMKEEEERTRTRTSIIKGES